MNTNKSYELFKNNAQSNFSQQKQDNDNINYFNTKDQILANYEQSQNLNLSSQYQVYQQQIRNEYKLYDNRDQQNQYYNNAEIMQNPKQSQEQAVNNYYPLNQQQQKLQQIYKNEFRQITQQYLNQLKGQLINFQNQKQFLVSSSQIKQEVELLKQYKYQIKLKYQELYLHQIQMQKQEQKKEKQDLNIKIFRTDNKKQLENFQKQQVDISKIQQQIQQNQNLPQQRNKNLKMDYGYKFLLRGIRKCLQGIFSLRHSRHQVHKMNEAELYEKVGTFIYDIVPSNYNPTQNDVWLLVLLIYPVCGINDKKRWRQNRKLIFNHVSKQDLDIFRDIFRNNRKQMINQFFKHHLIQNIWSTIYNNLKQEDCFGRLKKINISLFNTFKQIEQNLFYHFGLSLPIWWHKKFENV